MSYPGYETTHVQTARPDTQTNISLFNNNGIINNGHITPINVVNNTTINTNSMNNSLCTFNTNISPNTSPNSLGNNSISNISVSNTPSPIALRHSLSPSMRKRSQTNLDPQLLDIADRHGIRDQHISQLFKYIYYNEPLLDQTRVYTGVLTEQHQQLIKELVLEGKIEDSFWEREENKYNGVSLTEKVRTLVNTHLEFITIKDYVPIAFDDPRDLSLQFPRRQRPLDPALQSLYDSVQKQIENSRKAI